MNIHRRFYLFFFVVFVSCKKDWLDAKSDKSLLIPETLQDYQALLDNSSSANPNIFNSQAYPGLMEICADNYYILYNNWVTLAVPAQKNGYVWASDIYQGAGGSSITDWIWAYNRIFYENVILEGVSKIAVTDDNKVSWNNIKGSALFCRALDFYNLSQEFAKTYDSSTADTDLGIPLRLSSDISIRSNRSTLTETYNQIISDLMESIALLSPTPLGAFKTRPSKAAAFALLSKTYLVIGDYQKALTYADSCLQINSILLNYSLPPLNPSATFPFVNPSRFNNPEIIYYYTFPDNIILRNTTAIVDSNLFQSYNTNDLRKTIFFSVAGTIARFKGSYDGTRILFGGIATDEMYLTRAECFARTGNVSAALKDLNSLMINRWKNNGTFVPFTATNSEDALKMVLVERRKELIFRGLRWSDLRRLNRDSRFETILKRNLNGQIYTLMPNDPKYVLPIPDQEIQLSGIEQNIR